MSNVQIIAFFFFSFMKCQASEVKSQKERASLCELTGKFSLSLNMNRGPYRNIIIFLQANNSEQSLKGEITYCSIGYWLIVLK